MKRVLVSLLSTVLLIANGWVAGAEDLESEVAAETAPQAAAPRATAPRTILPISEIVLYSSGVGYFQRKGRIDGHGYAELRFKAGQVNDLLKSMVVQDFDGGRVTTVTYDSRDPITKALKSFAVDLTTNPGLGELLGQIRGERIEVATPGPVRGVIVGIEKKKEKAADQEVVEVEYLNLLTAEGLRSIPLSQVQHIQIANGQVSTELRHALEVLASSHDTQKKTMALEFAGEGRRRVQVAYIIEMPVWKTSYRLVLSDTERPFLQGWAIVENTTDEDWQEVKLSLMSGRPISFIMDMYEPLYVKRPVVVPELYASLRPQVYGQAMDEAVQKRLEAEAPAVRSSRLVAERRAAALMSAAGSKPAAREPSELDLQQGVISAAQALELGELFEYAIKTPVSLARQKSAMLPIVSEEVEGTKISVYNERVHAKHPLNGFRLKNSTVLYLMQGPITVFDGGIYAGDARIEDLAPGQERIISYAMDLKAEVEPLAEAGQQELVAVSLRKGTLLATRKLIEEKTYKVKNRDQKKKVMIIEHPFRPDWQLSEPREPVERTRDVYRFALMVDAGKEGRLHVGEEKQVRQTVRLMDSGPDVIAVYLQAKEVSAKVKEALQQVVTLRNRLDQTANQRSQLEQRIQEITQEQDRIRRNMGQLAQNSELYQRYVRKLNQQETEIEGLRREIESLKETEARRKRELDDYLLGLDIS